MTTWCPCSLHSKSPIRIDICHCCCCFLNVHSTLFIYWWCLGTKTKALPTQPIRQGGHRFTYLQLRTLHFHCSVARWRLRDDDGKQGEQVYATKYKNNRQRLCIVTAEGHVTVPPIDRVPWLRLVSMTITREPAPSSLLSLLLFCSKEMTCSYLCGFSQGNWKL